MNKKGESMDWNSRVFSLLLKTDKSVINAAVELSFNQIHANRDRKGYIDQRQLYFATPGNFSGCFHTQDGCGHQLQNNKSFGFYSGFGDMVSLGEWFLTFQSRYNP
jgi:hypothetical protein